MRCSALACSLNSPMSAATLARTGFPSRARACCKRCTSCAMTAASRAAVLLQVTSPFASFSSWVRANCSASGEKEKRGELSLFSWPSPPRGVYTAVRFEGGRSRRVTHELRETAPLAGEVVVQEALHRAQREADPVRGSIQQPLHIRHAAIRVACPAGGPARPAPVVAHRGAQAPESGLVERRREARLSTSSPVSTGDLDAQNVAERRAGDNWAGWRVPSFCPDLQLPPNGQTDPRPPMARATRERSPGRFHVLTALFRRLFLAATLARGGLAAAARASPLLRCVRLARVRAKAPPTGPRRVGGRPKMATVGRPMSTGDLSVTGESIQKTALCNEEWKKPESGGGCLTLSSCISILDEHSDCRGCNAQTVREALALRRPARSGTTSAAHLLRFAARVFASRSMRSRSCASCTSCFRRRATRAWSLSCTPARTRCLAGRGPLEPSSQRRCLSPRRWGCPCPRARRGGRQLSTRSPGSSPRGSPTAGSSRRVSTLSRPSPEARQRPRCGSGP